MSKELSRKKDKNPFTHIRNKTSADWYMYWLCEDEDFLIDMADIEKFWSSRYFDTDNPMTSEENKRLGVLMANIKAQYGISDDEFELIITEFQRHSSLDFPFRYIETQGDEVVIAVPSNIKRIEYINAWHELKDMLERETPPIPSDVAVRRNRGPENTQLIYAICKARKQKKTFNQIFELYRKGILPMYPGKSTRQFNSEDSLERYYDKYKPAR